MRKSVLKICSILLLMLFLLSGTSYALNNVASNTSIVKPAMRDNTKPNPPVIDGPSSGKIKETYTYYITVSDPDEDDLLIKIQINFGDGTTTCGGCDGRGPWHSGEVVEFDHSWTRTGTFGITGRVQDEHGDWSEWSQPLTVTMPKVKTNFFQFLKNFWFTWFITKSL
jgi:hypothetical protein